MFKDSMYITKIDSSRFVGNEKTECVDMYLDFPFKAGI